MPQGLKDPQDPVEDAIQKIASILWPLPISRGRKWKLQKEEDFIPGDIAMPLELSIWASQSRALEAYDFWTAFLCWVFFFF